MSYTKLFTVLIKPFFNRLSDNRLHYPSQTHDTIFIRCIFNNNRTSLDFHMHTLNSALPNTLGKCTLKINIIHKMLMKYPKAFLMSSCTMFIYKTQRKLDSDKKVRQNIR